MKGYKGVEYNTDSEDSKLCGFVFCEEPIDVLKIYESNSRYVEVEAKDVVKESIHSTVKIAKSLITLRELSFEDLAKTQIKYVKTHTKKPIVVGEEDNAKVIVGDYEVAILGDSGKAVSGYKGISVVRNGGNAITEHSGIAVAGKYGAATTGDYGIAISEDSSTSIAGYNGVAIVGDYGTATSRGIVSVGKYSCGLVRGSDVKIKGGIGSVLTICEEKDSIYKISYYKSFLVDGDKIKENTYYTLKDGKVLEVE